MSELSRQTVLVVGDTPENIDNLAAILSADYRVQTARNGRQALEIALSASPPDLVLLDILMPGMDGYEICRRLKGQGQTRDIPVIFISALDDLVDKVRGFEAGGVDHIARPFQAEEVRARVNTHLTLHSLQEKLELRDEQLQQALARDKTGLVERIESGLRAGNFAWWEMRLPSGQVTFDDRKAEMLGRPPDEFKIYEDFTRLLHPDDHEQVMQAMQDHLEGRAEHYEVEYRIQAGDGAYRWHRDVGGIGEQDGATGDTRVMGVVEDITERKRAELQLREAERRFRTLLDNVRLVAVGLDVDGRVAYANPYLLKLAGYALDEVVGKNWFETFLPEVLRPALGTVFKEILEGGLHPYHENPIVTRQGEERLIAWNNTVLLDETGQPVGAMSIGNDVTEVRRAEQTLREAEGLLRQVIDAMPAAIFIKDRAGNFLMVNSRVAEIYGTTVDQLVGTNESDHAIYPPEVLDRFLESDRQVIGTRQPVVVPESPGATRDGTEAWYHTVKVPLTIRGDPDCVLAVAVDVTERVRAERALREAEGHLRQQERLAAIGQLAGGIAHDFNNYLTVIMLGAQVALRKPYLPPDLARTFESALDASRRAATLVRQLLDFSRSSLAERRPLELDAWLNEFSTVLRRTLPESIEVTAQWHGADYLVIVDRGRIQQAVLNLATNARDAMPNGGELRIDLSRVVVSLDQKPPLSGMDSGEWICLAVSDSGAGMTADVCSHLFEPFFTTKEMGQGTGLGLAQVYGIVMQHKGHIGVESEPGQGTTFRIYLPPHTEAAVEVEEERPVVLRGNGETILLVEDEDGLREVGQEILVGLGYRVLTASQGREALEVYQSANGADLVITDMVMPQMGGKALMRALRLQRPEQKGLIITGYPLGEDLQELRSEGFIDTVPKPFDIETLAKVVRRALDED